MDQKGNDAPLKLGLALCFLAMMLDGLDNQLLGLIMPALIADWGLSNSAFTPFIIITVVLMSIGTILGGWLGDRFGRKPVLVVSMAMLGVTTLASSYGNSTLDLLVLRAFAAIGMGGVMPNATALLAEYVSPRHRSLSVAFGVASVPLGGVVGGVAGSIILPAFGWRGMFLAAGSITLFAVILIALLLPESPALKKAQSKATLADGASGARKTSVGEPESVPGQTIFSKALRRDTFALWTALVFTMLSVYSMVNWVPTMLSQQGYGLATSSLGLALFNVGGIVAAVTIGTVMDRYGSRRPLLLTGLGGGIAAILAIPVIAFGGSSAFAIVALAVMGFFIAGMQGALIAFSAQVYPTVLRSTGMGAMMGVGRLGALASSVTGTMVLAYGAEYFLLTMAAAITIAGILSLVVRGRAGSAPTPSVTTLH